MKKYELWKDIVFRHGPGKLKEFPGFHDEKIKKSPTGQRSSRLSLQYRVIYTVERDIVTVYVLEITPQEKFMKNYKTSEFTAAKPHTTLTTGEVIKMLRKLKGWTQAELAKRTGLKSTNISLLENNNVDIGKKRVELLARAFNVHPAIIMFPEYESIEIEKAV
ncbi:MAG: helix-turn-helix transcriptional regulator [Armatimonadota bacterium]